MSSRVTEQRRVAVFDAVTIVPLSDAFTLPLETTRSRSLLHQMGAIFAPSHSQQHPDSYYYLGQILHRWPNPHLDPNHLLHALPLSLLSHHRPLLSALDHPFIRSHLLLRLCSRPERHERPLLRRRRNGGLGGSCPNPQRQLLDPLLSLVDLQRSFLDAPSFQLG